MPQKRRSGGAAAAASSKSQSTLAFHGAKTNRVTKPGLVPSGANKGTSPNSNKLKSRTASPAPTAAVPSPKDDLESQPQEEEATAEADDEDPKTEDAATTAPPKLSEEDERALSLPEAKIKAYWAGKEKQRAAPRVHQQGLGLHEKVLREFDISGQYGPCVGISRLRRWRRAAKLSLEPPIEVLAVLLQDERDAGKGEQVAHVDELLQGQRIAAGDS